MGFNQGKNNPRYVDGRSEKREKWKATILKRDKYVCQRCGKVMQIDGEKFIAHHIKPRKEYPLLIFDINNGLTVCRPCHRIIHNTGENNPMAGKCHSKETREKMSVAHLGNMNWKFRRAYRDNSRS